MNKNISRDLMDEFTKIANETLLIKTLETRYSDQLDFQEVSVWGVADALQKAYDLGKDTNNQEKLIEKINSKLEEMESRFEENGWDENHKQLLSNVFGMIEALEIVSGKNYIINRTERKIIERE